MRMPGAFVVALLAAGCLFTACAGSGGGGGGGGSKPPPSCTPPPVDQRLSFPNNIQPIFNRSCALAGCHTAGTLSGNLDLSPGRSYSQLVKVPSFQMPRLKRVVPGHPSDSYLVLKIVGDPGTISGGPMPLGCPIPPAGGSCLGPDDLPAIRTWIEQCATSD